MHRPADVEIPAPVMRQIFLISPDLIFSAVASIETFPLKATSAPSLRNMLPIVPLVQFLLIQTAGFYFVVAGVSLYSFPLIMAVISLFIRFTLFYLRAFFLVHANIVDVVDSHVAHQRFSFVRRSIY